MNYQQICITHYLVGSLGYRFLDAPILLCKLGCLFARVSIHPKVKRIIIQPKSCNYTFALFSRTIFRDSSLVIYDVSTFESLNLNLRESSHFNTTLQKSVISNNPEILDSQKLITKVIRGYTLQRDLLITMRQSALLKNPAALAARK